MGENKEELRESIKDYYKYVFKIEEQQEGDKQEEIKEERKEERKGSNFLNDAIFACAGLNQFPEDLKKCLDDGESCPPVFVYGSREELEESGYFFLHAVFPETVKFIDMENITPISLEVSQENFNASGLKESYEGIKELLHKGEKTKEPSNKDENIKELPNEREKTKESPDEGFEAKMPPLSSLIEQYGKYLNKDAESGVGHFTQDEVRFFVQVINYLAGIELLKKLRKKGNSTQPLKVLFLENNPERKMIEVDSRLKGILGGNITLLDILLKMKESRVMEIYIFDGTTESFLSLYRRIKEGDLNLEVKRVDKFSQDGDEKKAGVEIETLSLEDINFLLIDIFLGKGQPDGVDFADAFREVVPHIPAFILSMSDSVFVIRDAMRRGADFYILKNQVFSLPLAYVEYIKSMGESLRLIKEDKFKKSLIGNIRYWNFKRDMLWLGDKCYHMVNHSYPHTLDDWNFINRVLHSLVEEKKFFRKYKEEEEFLAIEDDRLFYSFFMGIWLHDIGHKGSAQYGDAHLIRDNHGYISGEWILKHPELFGFVEKDDYYKMFDFDKHSAVEAILYRKGEGLSLVEMAALFAMYHKSNTPLDENEANVILGKGKRIPLEYYEGGSRRFPPITLRRILQERQYKKVDEFLALEALLRLFDAFDIRNVRSGVGREKEMRLAIGDEDKKFLLKKLQRTISELLEKEKGLNELARTLISRYFLVDLREKLERGELIKFEVPGEEEKIEELKNLIDFAAFVSFNPQHIELHSTIKDIRLSYNGLGKLSIVLTSESRIKELQSKKVGERGRKVQSIYERLIGPNCYIISEVKGAKRFLKNWFKEVEIKLITTDRPEGIIRSFALEGTK